MKQVGKNESITVSMHDDGTIVVEGDVDLAGGPILDSAISRLDASKPVIIDLASVDFIDSSGLRILLSASRRAQAQGATVVLRNPTVGTLNLLSITGTTEQFEVVAAQP